MLISRTTSVLSLVASLTLVTGIAFATTTAAPRPTIPPGTTVANVTTSPDSAPPRLSKDVWPTLQTVELTLDPDRADYQGRTRIELDVRRPVRELRFHTRAMTLDSLVLRGPAHNVRIAALERLVPDQTRVTLESPLAAGHYTLEIVFHNAYNTRAISLYQVKTGGHSYLLTQFEDTEAREAFPCFDEPEFKIPWEMTLVVPAADLAVSNTPVARERAVGAMRRVEFARSKPLPSYLIAIAVGPFDTVPIPGMSVPGRIITVKGATTMAAEAVRLAPPILAALERFFGRPYPYEKLDLIAAPEFLYGAMENAGAIVFADRRLLIDPRSPSPDQRRAMASVIAHEMAHMWFGDLVTMRWWDDLWLNESFASWMGTKVMDEVAPEYHEGITTLYSTQRAFAIDSRLSTRAMRGKVTGATNLGETASALAYDKGEAVLTLFEGWLGAETFRRGVIAYLKAFEWKNAEGADLWSALGQVSGEDVPASMRSFLERAGVPLVTVEPLAGGRVRLSQKRFVTVGEAPNEPGFWRIPVILRYPVAGSTRVQRAWLTGADTTVDLGGATPEWIHPNAGASGYYRWSLPPQMLDALVGSRASLDARERIDLIGNLTALTRAGLLHGDHYLESMNALADDRSPEVVNAALEALNDVRAAFETTDASSAYSQFVRATLTPPLDRFGMQPSAGESIGVALIRPALLRLLADAGKDERVLAYAESLSQAYRANPASVPASLVETSILLGAVRGDRALFEEYRHRFETTTVPAERPLFLRGLGRFRDPELRQEALTYALEGPLRPQERLMIPAATALNSLGPEPRGGGAYPDEIAEWTLAHFDQLRTKLPPNFATRIIGLGGGCSEERLRTLRRFFDDPEHRVQGGEATLRRLSDAMVECAKLSERERERVDRWLTDRMRRP